MDITDELMTPKEMLEKIAELDYGQSQLRDLNTEMRRWLDVADEDMALLRSENIALKKQVKVLEKIISEAQQVEAEPCRSLRTDDLDVKRCNEKTIQKLEEDSIMLREQNKKLTSELKSLQQEREQEKVSLSKLKTALKNLEHDLDEAELGLQHSDEIIHQKNLQLKHLEKTAEDCSIIIKDLRLTNQELRKQLEDRHDEASLSALSVLMEYQEGSLSRPLSFADEMKLLAASEDVKPDLSYSRHLIHKEAEDEEPLEPQGVTSDLQTKRGAGTWEPAVQRAALFLMCVLVLLVLVCMASGSCGLFSINTLWTCARLILQPYCSVHYGALPPI